MWANLIAKIRYIWKLALSAPHFGQIMVLQFVSGIFSFVGLPMLIPVLSYLNEDAAAKDSSFGSMERIFVRLGIEPNFYSILIIACALILVGQMLVMLSNLIAVYAQADLAEGYRKRLFEAYTKAGWLWLVDSRSGEINYSVMREVDVGIDAQLMAQRILIYLFQVLIFLGVAIKLSFTVTIMAIGVYFVLTLLNMINAKRIMQLSGKYNRQFTKLSNELSVMQQNKKFFKVSLFNPKLLNSMFGFVEDIKRLHKQTTFRIELQGSWNIIITFLFLATLMFFHKQLNLDQAQLFTMILVFSKMGPNFSLLSNAYAKLNSSIPMYESLHKRLNELGQNQEENGELAFDEKKVIRFDHVGFKYPNGNEVFDDLDLKIEPNKVTAFIGRSGVGKSTLLDLILGLLKPSTGAINYGDVSHAQLNKNSLRSKVVYVTQETTLIDGTLRENLTVTAPDATEEKVQEILQRVALTETIGELPQGLNTPVGENGIKLSGGQRQRVALARALFMDPKILILDEATSSLDAKSEQMIQETIGQLKKDLTIIIVTHKLSAVRFADTIYVLEEGRSIESGTYDELIAQKGQLYFYDTLQK